MKLNKDKLPKTIRVAGSIEFAIFSFITMLSIVLWIGGFFVDLSFLPFWLTPLLFALAVGFWLYMGIIVLIVVIVALIFSYMHKVKD